VIGRFGARLILQQALEDELTDFLGRERYEALRRGAGARAVPRLCQRCLDEHDLVHCFLDVYLKLRPPTSRPRACRSRGGSRSRVARCCSACSWAAARATRTGSTSSATSSRDAVHGDFLATQLLVRRNRLVGVLDWDGAWSGERGQDLALLLYNAFARTDRLKARPAPRTAVYLPLARRNAPHIPWRIDPGTWCKSLGARLGHRLHRRGSRASSPIWLYRLCASITRHPSQRRCTPATVLPVNPEPAI
jgi:hypothetical protein